MHTVCLIEDFSGWYAILDSPTPNYTGSRVRWSATFTDSNQAMSVLDVAHQLAERLSRGELAWRHSPLPDEGLSQGLLFTS